MIYIDLPIIIAMGLECMYKKKTDKEHILDNPDTYTGSMELTNIESFTINDKTQKIEKQNIENITMGVYKLFDEAVVNCRDHAIRLLQSNNVDCKKMTYISITIDNDGAIVFENDGDGIDIVEHPTYGTMIPEMIFFHLRTGTNYNKNEKSIVGGKNGFGSKLIFIWSVYGSIETVDRVRKLKYYQKCYNNLDIIEPPTVVSYDGLPFTRIKFKLDYSRMGLIGLSPNMISLFRRRVYDLAALVPNTVKVIYNTKLIKINTFKKYVNMYLEKGTPCIHQKNGRWEFAVCKSNNGFQHTSFVNGIYTSKGGKHVEYISNQLCKNIQYYLYNKKKKSATISMIKEHLFIFLTCDIENPSFDSQTKDFLTTPVNKFGSVCDINKEFCRDVIKKLGIVEIICDFVDSRNIRVSKKTDGTKRNIIKGIPKLIDANFAGTVKSNLCTIILCEGDSAKAGIMSGLCRDDRNYIGIFPLKGKLMNVRGEKTKRIIENKEIVDIKRIIGLETNKIYTENTITNLRYGKIIFMTDQDLDGSHIKGLGLNLFHTLWPSILKLNVIGYMNTPIIKVTKKNKEHIFYSELDYIDWKSSNDTCGWRIKYYKGLGTSTSKEFKEYFRDRKMITFVHDDKSDDCIDMVFNKKRSNDRKKWLTSGYDIKKRIICNNNNCTVDEFINHELIHFSKYDCDRSIPSLLDGLKTCQRKILFSAFKKNIASEVRVAQFSGYVSEHTLYHHGEVSLNGAIVNMAQTYVGSNNINLLMPNGQFGTRLLGGKDAASARYIYTNLNPITRYIYPDMDDDILKYKTEENKQVEPSHYIPIIPMILVNGAKGIGTGFSTDIIPCNPIDVIQHLMDRLNHSTCYTSLKPYYKGFGGSIQSISGNRYIVKGVYEKINTNTILITELPIGTWTTCFKTHLDKLMSIEKNKCRNAIKHYIDNSTDIVVNIKITFHVGKLETLSKIDLNEHDCNGIEKYLKLYTIISNNNIHAFDQNNNLRHFKCNVDLIDVYFKVRMDLYKQRKQHIMKHLKNVVCKLNNKVKYIDEILSGSIDIRNMTILSINNSLQQRLYDKIEDSYKYLLKMSMDSLSIDEVDRLKKLKYEKEQILISYIKTPHEQIWRNELMILKEEYVKSNELYNEKSKKRKLDKTNN